MRNVENFFAHFVPRMFLTTFNFFVIAIFEISRDAILDCGECTGGEAHKSSLPKAPSVAVFYLDLDEDMFSLAF